jgi:transposase
MKLREIAVKEALENARKTMEEQKDLPGAVRTLIALLITIIELFADRFLKNSTNSSIPPSQDPNREKKGKKNKEGKKPGAQEGRKGITLEPVENPDKIVNLKIKKSDLPDGVTCRDAGHIARQVVDIKIIKIVTEYRAQVLIDAAGNQYVAKFPHDVTQPIQYGKSVKAHAVYMSMYQLIPYNRIQDYFANELKISVSVGSLFNFNQEVADLLTDFEEVCKEALKSSPCILADETGINIDKKRYWLHVACNGKWVFFDIHKARGSEATDAIGILPGYQGVLCHDGWKPYDTYESCRHSLCNAHHLRDLQAIIDNNPTKWAEEMMVFLRETNKIVDEAGGCLSEKDQEEQRKKYREILKRGEVETPPPIVDPTLKKRGRPKKGKARNLLERFINREDDVLRFMTLDYVPFTNNGAENDIRMTKVQQKISGCFRAIEGAKNFCRIRGYLLTCQKHNVNPTQALDILLNKKLPDFCANYRNYAE